METTLRLFGFPFGCDLLLIGCEKLIPATQYLLPLGGSEFAQLAGLLISYAGLVTIVDAFRSFR
jgi:hypothetical protein